MTLNIPTTIVKASGLSAIIFWLIISSKHFEPEMLLLVLLSMIPISICCALTICLTIAPFYWSKKEGTNLKNVRGRYFPYYAITLFSLCTFAIIGSEFDVYVMAFITSAFFTALKSWSWIIEPVKTK
ncbi:hypothetical protein [Algibacter sp. R77976]|uniref:hypothetical protein n=1 Tax=Algibacter sp. R77976 TaxID=3093873 RepID=UPI0037C6F72A